MLSDIALAVIPISKQVKLNRLFSKPIIIMSITEKAKKLITDSTEHVTFREPNGYIAHTSNTSAGLERVIVGIQRFKYFAVHHTL